jgi:RNA polymerase sigma factor (sigma-70 family)
MPSTAVLRRADRSSLAYDQHRRYVLAVLARRCRWLADDEREALLHDAWAILLEKERSGALDVAAMAPAQVRAYLTQTAVNRALDESRRARMRDEPLAEGDRAPAAPGTALDEVVDADVEAGRIREILGELSARQQTIVKLRFFFDRSPGEIQQLLGVTERAYRRDLERALAVVGERFALVRDGGFCESRGSLIRAFVAGIAGPNRARKAREHLASCPACRHYALELRAATGRVAALAPMPVLTTDDARLHHLAELLTTGRDQAASLATRVDPGSPLTAAGARPGALAAALTACLAVGGGTTYCVVHGGLPGTGSGAAHERVLPTPPKAALATGSITVPASALKAAQARRPEGARTAPAATTKSSSSSPARRKSKAKAKSKSSKKQAIAARQRAARAAATAAASHEFGFESGTAAGSTASAGGTTPAPAPKKPSAAEIEFGP